MNFSCKKFGFDFALIHLLGQSVSQLCLAYQPKSGSRRLSTDEAEVNFFVRHFRSLKWRHLIWCWTYTYLLLMSEGSEVLQSSFVWTSFKKWKKYLFNYIFCVVVTFKSIGKCMAI